MPKMIGNIICVLGVLANSTHADPAPDEGTNDTSNSNTHRLKFRVHVGIESIHIRDVPEPTRHVTSYLGSPVTLSQNTGGAAFLLSLGVGTAFWRRLEFNVDFTYHDSGGGGRTTWNEVGFASDDYVDYAYSGPSIDTSVVLRLYKGLEVVFGSRISWASLHGGVDAYSLFSEQTTTSFPRLQPLVGSAYRFELGSITAVGFSLYLCRPLHQRSARLIDNFGQISLIFSLD